MHAVQAPKLEKLITKAHENKWVAISPDYERLVAVADSLQQRQRGVIEESKSADRDVEAAPGQAALGGQNEQIGLHLSFGELVWRSSVMVRQSLDRTNVGTN